MTPTRRPLVLIANARMPSRRAQSLQIAQAAAAYARRGVPTTLLYAERRDTKKLGDEARGDRLWDHYAVPQGPRPEAQAIACTDWIDPLPRALQYVPARLQELSFARNAARRVQQDFAGARVLSRELETAYALRGREALFLELHRVPGGRARRGWLVAAGEAAAGVVAVSGGVREDLIELGVDADKVLVAHDAFDPGRFTNLPDRASAREQLDLPQDRAIVAYTGGLLEWKGVDVLVAAAAQLPGVLFVIAGGMQADVERVRALAGDLDNVRLEGFQPPVRVPLYMAAADLGVVPNRSRPAISARYTSPLKVFEAMGAGLPLVASDLPSLREILSDEEAFFVPPDDPAALASGITTALEDASRREAVAALMRARSAASTWDARAESILAFMEARS